MKICQQKEVENRQKKGVEFLLVHEVEKRKKENLSTSHYFVEVDKKNLRIKKKTAKNYNFFINSSQISTPSFSYFWGFGVLGLSDSSLPSS